MATALNQLSLEYSCAELLQATNNFSENNRLGYGTFGGVFRGVQRDGTEIAVKVLEGPEEAGFEDLALSLCGCTVPQRFKRGHNLVRATSLQPRTLSCVE
ncbi:unnamed protein product [Durusdinium trenchii]|uniref:Protein kinase domain-containing protein n=1 Tax=Durusdinium trenchii TaxID=1381693 RepID=A0ABP0PFX3_9DINO